MFKKIKIAFGFFRRILYITENNLATPQFMDNPNAWVTVKIQARGAGYASYYKDWLSVSLVLG